MTYWPEIRYQLGRLAYAIRTPKVIREAERELLRSQIKIDLEEEADELWD